VTARVELFKAFLAWVSLKIRSKGKQKQVQMEINSALQNVGLFTRKLNGQLENKSEPEALFEKVFHGGYLLNSENLGGVLMAETEAREYKLLVNDVCVSVARHFGQAKTSDELHISKGAIESAIQSAILKTLDIPKQSKDPFEQRLTICLDELKTALLAKPEDWVVHMEVRGLAPERLPYQFGEIEFYVLGEKAQPSAENPAEKAEVTAPAKASAFSELFEPTKGAVYAAVPVKATDTEAAKVLAKRKLRLTLDALNFFGDVFDVLESRVTLPGDAAVSNVKTFLYSTKRPDQKLRSVGLTKPLIPFSFAAIKESSAKDYGFDRVSLILANASPTSLDDKILSSLQWAGRACIEDRREEAFLLFCISLEALLLKKQTGEITQTFALRGAHLLVVDAAHRREVFKDLKSLYGIRSSIVHSGQTQVTEADLSKIRWLAKTALLIMLVREPFSKMKTEDELENWFQTQLLAGVVTVTTQESNNEQGTA
jgi:hypothetical protein